MENAAPLDLTPADRRVVDEELSLLRTAPGSRDPQLPGCLLAFAGMVLLTLTPALGPWVNIPKPVGVTIFSLAVAALFAGAAVALGGGVLQARRARARQGAALAALRARDDSDAGREAALRDLTCVLFMAHMISEPGSATLLDSRLARELGPSWTPLAQAVERLVLSR